MPGVKPGLRLLSFVMLNDFSDDEVQEFLGEFRVEVGLKGQVFEPCDLPRFAVRIRRGKVVFGFQLAHRLGVLEPLAQSVDEDGIEPVDTVAVPGQKIGGARGGVFSQWASPSV